MIQLKNVSYKFKDGTIALENVNLDINDGEFVYIVGSNGSGKSTLFRLLNSELVPTKGKILVNGINVGKLPKRKVPKYRRQIGVIFQDFKLLNYKTVFENVAYALEVIDMKTKPIRERVKEVLNMVGLQDKHLSKPNELSGGQKQRVAIARAVAGKPKIIIADELTSNLDGEAAEAILKALERINEEEGTTILMVTHQAELINKHPRRVITLEQAHVAEDAPIDLIKASFGKYDSTKINEDVELTAERVIREEIIEKRNTEEFNLKTMVFEMPKGDEEHDI